MLRRERLDQLQVSIAQVQVRETNRAVIDLFGIEHGKAELVAPDLERGFGVGDNDGDVVEAAPRELRIEN